MADRIKRYLDECPPAVSGSGGHSQTFWVASVLIHGFSLSDTDAMSWLEYYNAKCQPPWEPRDLVHKIQSAQQHPPAKPAGWLLDGDWQPQDCKAPQSRQDAPQEAEAPKPTYDTSDPTELPQALPDATLTLLLKAFDDDDGVAICPAKLNGKRCVPAGGGTVHSRREWLTMLTAAGGDANKLFPGTEHGVFIRVNPMRVGGKTDDDVLQFRHALVEFDKCSLQEQWSIIRQSGIPCTAVLTSGNKSLHAWVRVDAKDAVEYASRVAVLYDHFANHKVDTNNKNPSRFSRLPGVRRGDSEQQLLATSVGAKSWQQWITDSAAAGIGVEFTLKELLAFDPAADQSCVIGNRWLCKGGSVLWIGQSGIGKSSLSMQAAITWALAKPFFGVETKKALKSLFIQGENDLGDTAEMLKGVLMGAFGNTDPAKLAKILQDRLVIIREQQNAGRAFANAAEKLIAKHRPDLVWIDPLFSFFGDDVSNQKACSQFLREWLNPIATGTGVCWMILHHTGKPSKDPKAYGTWRNTDFSYMGTGSAELVNWARAAVFLKGIDDDAFQLMFTKRGTRAGATALDGEPTRDVYLKHAETGICWEQIESPLVDTDLGKKHAAGMKATAEAMSGPMHSRDIKALICQHCNVKPRQASNIWSILKPLLTDRGNNIYERDPSHY